MGFWMESNFHGIFNQASSLRINQGIIFFNFSQDLCGDVDFVGF